MDTLRLDAAEAPARTTAFFGRMGLNLNEERAPDSTGTKDFSGENTDKDGRIEFRDQLKSFNSFNPELLKTLSTGPQFYENDFDSADFGYGLKFSYWLWSDDSISYLITTDVYDSAGSSALLLVAYACLKSQNFCLMKQQMWLNVVQKQIGINISILKLT